MRVEKLSRADVLRQAQRMQLRFQVKQDGDRWVVFLTANELLTPIEVGQASTPEAAWAFVEEKRNAAASMMPSILEQARGQEVPAP